VKHPLPIRGALVALLCFVTVAAAGSGVKVGDAVDFELPGADGTTVRLSELRGKPVVVNFWASWCEPCIEELPRLDGLHGRLGEHAKVVAVNVDRQRGPAAGVVDRLSLGLPVVFDAKGSVVAQWSPPGLPATFTVDPQGAIHAVRVGELTAVDVEGLEREVRALLPEQ